MDMLCNHRVQLDPQTATRGHGALEMLQCGEGAELYIYFIFTFNLEATWDCAGQSWCRGSTAGDAIK